MRPPRKTFAAPLVVTLAACSASKDAQPPEEPHRNPPAIQRDAATPDPKPPDVIVNPPPPQQHDLSWRVTKTNGKCYTVSAAPCPEPPPGQPAPTCNPPAPVDYQCPANLAEGGSETIIKRAGEQICMIPPGAMKCPEHAACNPPPPRQVPCP